jgi:hypothetical protein
MKNKILLMLLSTCLCNNAIHAQVIQPDPPPKAMHDQEYMNQSKYWFYRNRLTNEFMKVGPNPGESTPLAYLRLNPITHSNPVTANNRTYSIGDAGDGMLRSGGYYIGVLATEYYMLKNSGQDVSGTLEELFFALNAIKRLDETAETYSFCNADNGHPNQNQCYDPEIRWNGFMIRDDMDCGLNSPITKYFQTKLSNPRLFLSTQLCFNLHQTNQLIDGDDRSDRVTNNDVSKDQINFLMIGMRLVQKYLDIDAYYDYNGERIYLKFFANSIITRILDHMAEGATYSDDNCQALLSTIGISCDKQNKYICDILGGGIGPAVCTRDFIEHKRKFPWMIENTVTKQESCITIDGAGYAGFTSGGFGPTANLLTGNKYYVAKEFNELWKAYNLASLNGVNLVAGLGDNHQILTQVALGDSWNVCLIPPAATVKVCVIHVGICVLSINVPIPSIPGGKSGCPFGIKLYDTQRSLHKQSVKAHYEVLPLLHNVLFDRRGYFESELYNFFQEKLDHAPSVGPYCLDIGGGNKLAAPYGWASNYIIDMADRGDNSVWNDGKNENVFWGEYNGLDYMLMYNLYNIYNSKFDYYINYADNLKIHDRLISKQEYFNARSYVGSGGNLHNGTIVFDNVTIKKIKNNDPAAYVDARAGDYIKIKSGVHIASGSQFHGYIYQPSRNWDWEMTISSHFDGTTNRPDGYRMGLSGESEETLTDDNNWEINENRIQVTHLENNIPNPATGITTIPYYISQSGTVELIITDLYGKEIAKPVNTQNHEVGNYKIELNVSDYEPGVYVYMLKATGYSASKKMIVLK